MTLPDPATPRKARRLGLWGPFAALAVGLAAWSAGWLWLRGEADRRLDAASAAATRSGGTLSWSGRHWHGYPFRLDVDFTGLVWRDPSGWALAAPSLKTEAFVFAPGHWVAVAPGEVTLTRPAAGPVVIRGQVLRASVSEFAAHPPRVSLEGLGLSFATPPGAHGFFLSAARTVHVHTRAGPGGQGAIFLEVDGGQASQGGLFAAIAGGGPVNLVGDAIASHADALRGPDWPAAARAWSEAGGALEVRRLLIQAGPAVLEARSGALAFDRDGRLSGALPATLRQAPRALAAMSGAGMVAPEAAHGAGVVLGAAGVGPALDIDLHFQAGRTTLGPVAIGPSPKVY